METKKTFTDLYTTQEFIDYYDGASKRELRERLKTLQAKQQTLTIVRNEILAIKTWLL